jgi:hypothetical protein
MELGIRLSFVKTSDYFFFWWGGGVRVLNPLPPQPLSTPLCLGIQGRRDAYVCLRNLLPLSLGWKGWVPAF